MKEIIITENEAGQRLDKFLAKYLNEATKSFYYKMLRKKNIVLNGKKATGNEKLNQGDSVKLFLSDETIAKFSSTQIAKAEAKLDILYEDDHILLINKPVGMLSQKAEQKDESLVEYVTSYLLNTGQLNEESLRAFRPSICNRLDRNTSGIITAGKSLAGLQTMGELFKHRTLKKYYRCLVAGTVQEPCYIKGYLTKDRATNKVTISEKGPETAGTAIFGNPKAETSEKIDVGDEFLPIETEYTPVKAGKNCTLLEVHLITGRTHQIRAHLASIGHPIIGDYKYGNRKVNEDYKKRYGLTSQLLHAYRLEFPEMEGELSNLSEKCFIAPVSSLFQKIADDSIG